MAKHAHKPKFVLVSGDGQETDLADVLSAGSIEDLKKSGVISGDHGKVTLAMLTPEMRKEAGGKGLKGRKSVDES